MPLASALRSSWRLPGCRQADERHDVPRSISATRTPCAGSVHERKTVRPACQRALNETGHEQPEDRLAQRLMPSAVIAEGIGTEESRRRRTVSDPQQLISIGHHCVPDRVCGGDAGLHFLPAWPTTLASTGLTKSSTFLPSLSLAYTS